MNVLNLERRTTATLLVSVFVLFCFLGGDQLQAMPMSKTEICHFDADQGVFKKISVSGKAVQKHLENHGDIFPGGQNDDGSIALDEECNEVTAPPAVLARAYIDKNRDGMFDPLEDVEIAELIDTDPDGLPSVGDSVELGQYPKTDDPCPIPTDPCPDLGNFNPLPLNVATVEQVDSEFIIVTTTGGTFFNWTRAVNSTATQDFFGYAAQAESNVIIDNDGTLNRIDIFADDEPAPSDPVSFSQEDPLDNYFINVELFVTP